MKEKNVRQERWALLGAAGVALLALALLTAGVWRQVHRLRDLAAAQAELDPLVTYQEQRNDQLRQELDHVSSPDYVEEWARVEGGMTRPGEVRLIVPPVQETAVPTATPTPPAPSFWQRLWRQLTGGGN